MIHVVVKNAGPLESAEFDIKGVTLLTGESGAGKSSLLSALTGAFYNKFPSKLLRFGETNLSVELTIDDELIQWNKRLNTSAVISFRGETLSKTSQYTVEALETFLNMQYLEVGNEKVNIHFVDQFDAPLIKNFSHKKLSDVLSASSEIDNAHKLLKIVKEESLKTTGSFNLLQGLIAESRLRIETLTSIVQIGNDYKPSLFSAFQQAEDEKKRLDIITAAIPVLEMYNDLFARVERKKQIAKGYAEIIAQNQRISYLNQCIQYYEDGVVLKRRIDALKRLVAKYREYDGLIKQKNLISTALVLIERGVDKTKRIEDIKQFTENGICPICGRKIEEHERKGITE
jgi:DNA repair exonuclease SbcCD ATPase subunit